jgi:hypothetical protein
VFGGLCVKCGMPSVYLFGIMAYGAGGAYDVEVGVLPSATLHTCV